MTTQTPYQPTPPDPYPTAPPWAPVAPPVEPEQAGVGQPGWGGVPYTPHGQLMVKYPQALQEPGRPQAPAVWPVVLFTILFGLFGSISAARRAARAGRSRKPKAPYWIAFGATAAACYVAWSIVFAVAKPYVLDFRQSLVTDSLQDQLVHDGHITTPKGTSVASAKCRTTDTATLTRAASAYTCVLTLNNGKSASVKLTAADDGSWTVRK
jgi:hypothetical protein